MGLEPLDPSPPSWSPPPGSGAAAAAGGGLGNFMIVAVVFAFVFLGEWWSRIFYEVLTVLWFPLGRGAVKKVDDVLEELETVSPEAFARVEAATEAGTAKAVFVFTRHLGCPCAEATAARVHALAATSSREVLYVLVMPGTPAASRAFLELATKKQGPAFAVSASHRLLLVGDAAGKLYSYFGVPVTGPMHMLKSSSAARARSPPRATSTRRPAAAAATSRPPPSSRCSRRRSAPSSAPSTCRSTPSTSRTSRRLGEGRDDHRAHPHLVHDGAAFDDRHDERRKAACLSASQSIYNLIHTSVFTAVRNVSRGILSAAVASARGRSGHVSSTTRYYTDGKRPAVTLIQSIRIFEFLISVHVRSDRSTRTTTSTNNDAGAPDDAADHHRDYQPEQTLARCMERARARLASRLMDETK